MKPSHPTHPTRHGLRWLPAAAWACVIFAGSSVPGSRIPGGYSVMGHLAEYAVFGALLVFALWRGVPADAGRVAWTAMAIAALFAISDEFHQAFVPLRTPDVRDWVTDVLGASVGLAFVLLASARAARRRPSGLIDEMAPEELRASSEERSP